MAVLTSCKIQNPLAGGHPLPDPAAFFRHSEPAVEHGHASHHDTKILYSASVLYGAHFIGPLFSEKISERTKAIHPGPQLLILLSSADDSSPSVALALVCVTSLSRSVPT